MNGLGPLVSKLWQETPGSVRVDGFACQAAMPAWIWPILTGRWRRPNPTSENMTGADWRRDLVHTEHLQNVRTLPALGGWLVAIGATSLLVFVFIASGLLGPDGGEELWVSLALIVGFWTGGYFAGFRAMQAPILHGIALGLTSILAWFLLNLVASLFFPTFRWEALTPALTAGLLLGHIVAAVVGALMGYNMALRGRPTLEEHPPEGVASQPE